MGGDGGVVDLAQRARAARERDGAPPTTTAQVQFMPAGSPAAHLPGGVMQFAAVLLGGTVEKPVIYDATGLLSAIQMLMRAEIREAFEKAGIQLLADPSEDTGQ